jgi:signal transduction histidine kinase
MEVEVEPDAVVRGVDPDKVERALTNVLENAAKFTPEHGAIEVRGWAENGVAPPRVQCAVTNTGSTIPDEDLPHVFDRFFRGDRARRTSSGSGLGLAIAHELVSMNQGTISAQSDDGSVTFMISLPG